MSRTKLTNCWLPHYCSKSTILASPLKPIPTSSKGLQGLKAGGAVPHFRRVGQGVRNSRLSGGVGARGSHGVEDLPARMQEIVRLFQREQEPRAKYERLLQFARELKPLGKQHLTPENKVPGCVSQVWIAPSIGSDKRFFFEAEADSLLTKGLAALLVEGLSGATAEEVLRVSPSFIHMLGLKQSLTPSRSNGFLNMLTLVQKKTSQLMHMDHDQSVAHTPLYSSASTTTHDGTGGHDLE
jgi:sulfur transfer protein SufE